VSKAVQPSRRGVPESSTGGNRARQSIIDAGTVLFAERGYCETRVEQIVLRAKTTKPMLYYYFGSKDRLFAAVLENVYARMRTIEQSLELSGLPAMEAMRRVVQVTFDYSAENPDWIRLISIANIHYAKHIVGSQTIAPKNAPIIEIMKVLLKRGVEEGVFRKDVDPLHLHLLIISLCYYRVSNRHTWKVIFRRDIEQGVEIKRQRAMAIDAVLRYLDVRCG
jgi:AcrR family transcriptional regulator